MKFKYALGAALMASACAAQMTAAPAGQFLSATKISMTLDHSWTQIPPNMNYATTGAVLTRHGVALDRVDLISLAPGEAIVRAGAHDDAPRFRDDMSELELVELVTSSLTRMGFTDVQTQNVRPQQFSGAAGVRFSISGKYHSGLDLRGDAVLAKVNGKLEAIIYTAPASHYYEANEPEIDHLIQTAHVG